MEKISYKVYAGLKKYELEIITNFYSMWSFFAFKTDGKYYFK
jgi:hypothetical protein